jgi:hypothetical protein
MFFGFVEIGCIENELTDMKDGYVLFIAINNIELLKDINIYIIGYVEIIKLIYSITNYLLFYGCS